MQTIQWMTLAVALLWAAGQQRLAAQTGEQASRYRLAVEQRDDQLLITNDPRPVATYVLRDAAVKRPYFANVHAPSGSLVTRHQPPRMGLDAMDHATMHPGLWLAFGDISGQDFWRNRGHVELVEFVQRPQTSRQGNSGVMSFAIRYRYVGGDGVVCQELARHVIRATREGYLFEFDSEFSGDNPFAFGDQEEMGLGVRIATPLIVKGGTGAITSSEGRINEQEVWGRQSDWCDYSGHLPPISPAGAGSEPARRVGLLVVPHPANFRRSWMHARDYGLLVANPFGQRAFTKGQASRVEIKPGQVLRLRFGVWAYETTAAEKTDLKALAAQYVRLADDH